MRCNSFALWLGVTVLIPMTLEAAPRQQQDAERKTEAVQAPAAPDSAAPNQTVVDLRVPPARSGALAKTPSPFLMSSLYASYGALQVIDYRTTQSALAGGAVEANPVMHRLVNNRAAFAGVKIGVTAAMVGVAEYLRRHGHKTCALALMIFSNGITGFATVHNASVMGKMP